MIDKQIGSIIVTEHDQPRGIVTERDLVERVVAPCRDPNQTKIKEIMSTPLITISKETGILDAMRKMRKKDISRLVVMDDGTLIGLISEKDVIRAVTISSITSFSTLLRKRR
jgi:signal-transduction protein with cAMP-binding, CBS, and nucleotidyltransferase domain